MVVGADGSDQHVVATQTLTNTIPGYAWTPDSTRLITPPLPAEIGYTYFSIYNPVAPMIRPSNGDEIALLGPVDGVISAVGIDGRQLEGFESPSLTEFEPYVFTRPTWSPDGTRISFGLSTPEPFEEHGLFVMNADGSDLQRFETEFSDRAWSPAGSKIALEKLMTVRAARVL